MRIAGLLRLSKRAAFRQETRGSIVVESLGAILILSLGASALFTFWDAYQTKNEVQKATYTLSDLISRQRGTTLSRPFLDGMAVTAQFLIPGQAKPALRISQIRRISGTATDAGGLTVDWSYSPCGRVKALATGTVGTIRDKLQMIDLGSALIVLELDVDYDAGMPALGFGKMTHRGFLTSLPRFEQQFALTGTETGFCG